MNIEYIHLEHGYLLLILTHWEKKKSLDENRETPALWVVETMSRKVLTPVFQAQHSITIYISLWQKFSKILNPQLKHGNPKSGAEEALFSSDDRGPFATLVPTLIVLCFAVSWTAEAGKKQLNQPQVIVLTISLPDHLSLSSLLLCLDNNLPIKSSAALQVWFQSFGCTVLQNAQCWKETKCTLIKA